MLGGLKYFSLLKQSGYGVCFKFTTIKSRNYSKSNHMKVALIGATGRIGLPLSLLLKQSAMIDELAIHDLNATNGIAMELAHVDTKCKMSAAKGMDGMKHAVENAKVVVIVAAAPRSNLLAISAMFEANAELMKELAEQCSQYCPQALFAIATSPVNSLMPLFSEVLKKNGVYNPNAVFGVTTLNVVRANTFVAEVLGLEPECVIVPVVGGNAGKTIVPLLSHAKPVSEFSMHELETLTINIQKAHENIVRLKRNDSPTLSSAFAIARFVISLVKGLQGESNIVECAFVKTLQYANTKYFASPIQLGSAGMQKNLGVPDELTDYEQCQVAKAIKLVDDDVKRGEVFLGILDPLPCDPCEPEQRPPLCPPDWCEKRQNKSLKD